MSSTILSSGTTPTNQIYECKDIKEAVKLCPAHGLYIKPIARVNVTVQLSLAKVPVQTQSTTLEIIEKLKKQIQPEEFLSLRITKQTLDFIRFEGEIENKSNIKSLLAKLDGATIKLPTYTDLLKLRAAEAKITYPTKQEWESYYSTTQNPNELNTIHIQDLPCKWFSSDKVQDKPSESVIREVFGTFGDIRSIDIPILDRISNKYYTLTSTPPETSFDLYVQYKDHIGFVKAMDTFRCMKVMYIDPTNSKLIQTTNIRVDFDRTKHFIDEEIQKRSVEKFKYIELMKIKTAQFEKEREKAAKRQEIANYKLLLEESMKEEEKANAAANAASSTSANISNVEKILSGDDDSKSKEQRRKEREEARRQKRLEKKKQEEEKKLALKIAVEERKILIAQRKLESMRLLEELFNRVKTIYEQEAPTKLEEELLSYDRQEKQAELLKSLEETNKQIKEEADQQQQEKQQQQQQQLKVEPELNQSHEFVSDESFELMKEQPKPDIVENVVVENVVQEQEQPQEHVKIATEHKEQDLRERITGKIKLIEADKQQQSTTTDDETQPPALKRRKIKLKSSVGAVIAKGSADCDSDSSNNSKSSPYKSTNNQNEVNTSTL